ncbi:MAG: thiol-disulfide oxidoreductase DCC family protein [Cycloclasticus pugetii]|jgi:predicted DCC family thiol-disulfide oxidoreductase YuxK|uniref:thiol-disulfide oxidoreductase DCC family protein n=1 Tax=Cycloclasticus pugetii TaxID=34068 RepID=UPI003A946493
MNPSLYYDGSCPLCSKEISVLKRLSNDGINFVDIHQINDEGLPSKDNLLKRLHLRKTNGEWLVGLDANVYAWSLTHYGILFKILRIWPIRSLADSIYNRWADQRFKKRYQCNECSV